MTAFRILLLVLGLAVVGFVAKYALTGTAGTGTGLGEPARQLDQVRDRAHQLEGQLQRSADRAEAARDAE